MENHQCVAYSDACEFLRNLYNHDNQQVFKAFIVWEDDFTNLIIPDWIIMAL